ncbi:MAG: lyase family protein [Bacteroidales bacterium]
MRTEKDVIGEMQIPENALYGIHSMRAKHNFPDRTPFHIEWFKSVATVKLAVYQTYFRYKQAVESKYSGEKLPFTFIQEEVIDALIKSSTELSQGKCFDDFIVPGVQGGAGTSINMNVNEIIANRALQILDKNPGQYNLVDPFEHANVFQSTNDVIPTALKITIMKLLLELEERINHLRAVLEQKERSYRNDLRMGFTQLQEAVPSSFGKLFGAYNDALSRDWWRVSKALERIKIVNIGGSAIGTGLSVPTYMIMEVVPTLQRLTGLPVTRSENLTDPTSNLDPLVEVHAILKSHAVNLEKIVSDIRLLSSDMQSFKEITIPQKQVGSSVMPGKINPVIPEFVISASHKIYSNDSLISSLCGQGQLELNAYIPVIGHALIDSLKLLIAAGETIQKNLIEGMVIYPKVALKRIYNSPSVTTALTPYIGYNKASDIAYLMKNEKIDIFQANEKLKYINKEKLKSVLSPEKLLKLGYQIQDLIE